MIKWKVEAIDDHVKMVLERIERGEEIERKDADLLLKKRKLIKCLTWKTYQMTKGPKFALKKSKQATDLSYEMIKKGTNK